MKLKQTVGETVLQVYFPCAVTEEEIGDVASVKVRAVAFIGSGSGRFSLSSTLRSSLSGHG